MKPGTILWIHVDTELPDDGTTVLAADYDGEVDTAFYDGDLGWLWASTELPPSKGIYAWAQLPAAPVVDEEDSHV